MGSTQSIPKSENLDELSKITGYSTESLIDLYKAFQALDTDGSGELDRDVSFLTARPSARARFFLSF
jgi:Ca2+-binding EF-hand superfamily protein